jgi:hypothetical protein
MARLPDVIPVARPISGTTRVIRAITDGHSDGTRITSVIGSVIIPTAIATIIGSIARISAVVASASYQAERCGN